MNDIGTISRERVALHITEGAGELAVVPARKPVDLATYYKAAEEAGRRATGQIFDATISLSSPALTVLGISAGITAAFVTAVGAAVGDASTLSAGQGGLVIGAVTALFGYLRRRRTIPEEGVRKNRQELLAIDAELQPAAAGAAEAVLTHMRTKRSEKKLSQPALDRLEGAFEEMRSKARVLTDNERAASAIAAAVTQLGNIGFYAATDLTIITDQLAQLSTRDAGRVASAVALKLFDGPESRYAPRFDIDDHAPRHVLDAFRTELLAYVPRPWPVERGLRGFRTQAWIRAGEEITIPGVGPAISRGVENYPRYETLDGKEHTAYDRIAVIRGGARYHTIA